MKKQKIIQSESTDNSNVYQQMLDECPFLIFKILPSGNISYFNKKFSDYFSIDIELDITNNIFDFIPPQANEKLSEIINEIEKSKNSKKFNQKVLIDQKKEIIHRWIVQPIIGSDGNVSELYITAEELPEQELLDNETNQYDDLSNKIIENNPTLICRISGDGTINYINPACEKISGYNSNELLGTNWWEKLFPAIDSAKLNQLIIEIKKSSTEPFELELTAKNGDKKTILWNSISRFDEKKNLTEVIGFGNDITEKKLAYEEISKRFDIEKSISIISSLFVGSYDINECITFALQILGKQTSSQRSFILQLNKSGEYVSNTFEWCNENITPQIKAIQNIPKKSLLTFWEFAIAGRPFATLNNIDKLPFSKKDFDILKIEQNDNILLVPFSIDEELIGILGISKSFNDNNYTADDLNILQTSAQIFGNAWQKVLVEKELFLHKQHLSKAQENANLGSWEWNFVEGKMIWSDEMFRLFSIDRSKFSGTIKDWLLLPIIEPDRQEVFKLFKKLIEEHRPQQFEFRIKKGSEKILTLLGKSEVVYNTLRNPQKIFGTVQDITELRETQIELKSNEEKITSIIDAIPIPIFYKNINGIYKECNIAFTQYLGIPKNKIINSSAFDISSIEEAQIDSEIDSKLFIDGNNTVYEAKFKHADGLNRDVIYYKSTIKDTNDKIIGLVGAMLDISDRKAMEESIQNSQKLISQIVDTVPLMVYAKDINGKFIFSNQKTTKFYNKTTKELENQKQTDLHKNLSNEKAAQLIDEDKEIILSRESKYIPERIFTDYLGKQSIVEIDKIPINLHGQDAVLSVVSDITEKKYANEALKRSEKRYRTLVENNFHLIAETDAEGKYIYINSGYSDVLNYQPHDLIGTLVFEKIHPEDRNSVINKFMLDEAEAVIRYQHKNGTWVWFESFGKKYLSNDKEVRSVIISRNITARKLAEEEIKKSERNYREIFNATQSAIFILDELNYSILDVNNAATNLYGYSQEELILNGINGISYGKHPYSFANLEDWTKKLNENPNVTIEWLSKKKDETLFWTELILQYAWINSKKRLIIFARDIGERKRNDLTQKAMFNIALAVNKARDLNEFFVLIQKELSQVFLAKNIQVGLYNKKNKSITIVFQRDEKFVYNQIDYKTSFGMMVIKQNESILLRENEIIEHINSGKYEVLKEPAKCLMGVPLKVHGNVIGVIIVQSYDSNKAYNSEDLNFLEFVSTQVAVSILKKQDERRIETLTHSVQQSPASIIITDTNGFIEYVNPKFEEITGYNIDDVIGKRTNVLDSGANKNDEYKTLWKTIANGGEWNGELLNKKKNGELYWESMRISPIKNEMGEISHYLYVGEDVTAKKEIEENLIAAKQKAEKSNELKTEFLAQMSHEVRTPINNIISFSNLLKDDLQDKISDDLQNGFVGITHAGKRLIRTIDLILNMAEVQSGNYEIEKTELDLYSDILEIVYFEHLKLAKEKGLTLNLYNRTNASQIIVDSYTIHQVFVNLVDNAIKYTEQGFVKIILEETENYFHAIVEDTGIGISQEFLPNLFDPFSQEDQGYTRRYEGNGLGLALVKNYCALNNAEISVDSKKGKWTKFKVSFRK